MVTMLPVTKRWASWSLAGVVALSVAAAPQAPLPDALDKAAAKWVEDTFKKMTLDDKVGQLIVSSTQLDVSGERHRRVRRARAEGEAAAHWRHPCVRRRGAVRPRAAERQAWRRHSRSAAGGRVAAEPPADANRCCRCSTPATSKPAWDSGSAARRCFRGRWPSARPATSSSPSRPRASPPWSRARSACTSISRRSPTSTTTRRIPSSTRARSAKRRTRSAASRRRTCAAFAPAACSRR